MTLSDLYIEASLSQSQGQTHVNDGIVTLPQVGNATPPSPPSPQGLVSSWQWQRHQLRKGEGGRGLTLLWQSGFYAID